MVKKRELLMEVERMMEVDRKTEGGFIGSEDGKDKGERSNDGSVV